MAALHNVSAALAVAEQEIGALHLNISRLLAEKTRLEAQVYQAHRLLFHSTLGSRVIKKKKKQRVDHTVREWGQALGLTTLSTLIARAGLG